MSAFEFWCQKGQPLCRFLIRVFSDEDHQNQQLIKTVEVLGIPPDCIEFHPLNTNTDTIKLIFELLRSHRQGCLVAMGDPFSKVSYLARLFMPLEYVDDGGLTAYVQKQFPQLRIHSDIFKPEALKFTRDLFGANSKRTKEIVYVIVGGAHHSSGAISTDEYFLWLAQTSKKIRRKNTKAKILYCAHRRSQISMVVSKCKELKITPLQINLPIELYFLVEKIIPVEIYGLHTSACVTMSAIFPDAMVHMDLFNIERCNRMTTTEHHAYVALSEIRSNFFVHQTDFVSKMVKLPMRWKLAEILW